MIRTWLQKHGLYLFLFPIVSVVPALGTPLSNADTGNVTSVSNITSPGLQARRREIYTDEARRTWAYYILDRPLTYGEQSAFRQFAELQDIMYRAESLEAVREGRSDTVQSPGGTVSREYPTLMYDMELEWTYQVYPADTRNLKYAQLSAMFQGITEVLERADCNRRIETITIHDWEGPGSPAGRMVAAAVFRIYNLEAGGVATGSLSNGTSPTSGMSLSDNATIISGPLDAANASTVTELGAPNNVSVSTGTSTTRAESYFDRMSGTVVQYKLTDTLDANAQWILTVFCLRLSAEFAADAARQARLGQPGTVTDSRYRYQFTYPEHPSPDEQGYTITFSYRTTPQGSLDLTYDQLSSATEGIYEVLRRPGCNRLPAQIDIYQSRDVDQANAAGQRATASFSMVPAVREDGIAEVTPVYQVVASQTAVARIPQTSVVAVS